MPQFAFNIDDDLEKLFSQIGERLDEIAPKMLDAATPIVQKEVQNRAPRSSLNHKHIADNVAITKPKKTKDGAWIANVTIKGSRDGVRLMEVAAYNEYGTKNMSAQPFLRPAIAASERRVNDKMREVFESEMSK